MMLFRYKRDRSRQKWDYVLAETISDACEWLEEECETSPDVIERVADYCEVQGLDDA